LEAKASKTNILFDIEITALPRERNFESDIVLCGLGGKRIKKNVWWHLKKRIKGVEI